jgi:hypothetical protein
MSARRNVNAYPDAKEVPLIAINIRAMKRVALAIICALALGSHPLAQRGSPTVSTGARDLIGTWTLVSTDQGVDAVSRRSCHQVLAGISPAAGTTLKRFYELKGTELSITFPPGTNQQGQQTTTLVTLKRLSGAKEMLR